jgi:polyhydroxybutyrate depolymerase
VVGDRHVKTIESRKIVIAVVLALVSLPALLAFAEALSYAERNRSDSSIVSSGVARDYILYVPPSYDRTIPAPLVISLHGAGGWAAMQRDVTDWNRVADEHGFIVAYPSGSGRGPKVWNVNHGPGLMQDVRFISDLIDTVQQGYNIDPSRIYANGLSNGGGMSFVLSCTLSHRIAAVGLVGSAQSLPFDWCTDRRPVPMISIHGTADRLTRYEGGLAWVAPNPFPGVPAFTASWARRNQCAPDPTDVRIAPDVVRRSYAGCANDASVVLYTIEGGGHTWPGGAELPYWLGPTNRSIHASREMWAFFRKHPLRAESGQ